MNDSTLTLVRTVSGSEWSLDYQFGQVIVTRKAGWDAGPGIPTDTFTCEDVALHRDPTGNDRLHIVGGPHAGVVSGHVRVAFYTT
jgi:hypothetical protein